MSAQFVTSGGIELAVFEEGNRAGPAVLLVHGYPDTHEVWDEMCAELAADHRLVRYDVRGAGRSGRPVNLAGYRLSQLADDLFAVIDAAGGQAHVVAHDWGSIQAWHAVTDPRAAGRIASFTSISGPCLDHVGYWFRRRLLRPTPRHVAQLGRQLAKSWYIGVFQLPLLAPAAWRWGLARRWPAVLHRVEGVAPRPGFPADTLCGDAIRGISLYRANMGRRRPGPQPRRTGVPVQLITLTRDRYVSPALSEGLERWVPNLTRRTLAATHWSALTVQAPAVAGMIREFASAH
jgi:pimeloyl-ACP methyl ester carboxylesterase